MNISLEAKHAAEAELEIANLSPQNKGPVTPCGFQVQIAINAAISPLQKEINRLKGEIVNAWREAQSDVRVDVSTVADFGEQIEFHKPNWNNSRARRVAEGKE